MTNSRIALRPGSGYSLIEMMIAMTIGMFLLAGLTFIFANSSEANRELQKTAQQIENGRYAAELLFQDLRHAGFYGHLTKLPAAPASLPDPCITPTPANLIAALAIYIQAYNAPDVNTAPDVSATTCAAQGLTAANLKPGSDVVVIRRADTGSALASTATAVLNEVYLQATSNRFDIQLGNGAVLGTNKANGGASTLFLSNNITPSPPAPIRKYRVHIYFVAPCSTGSGAGGVCQSGDDAIPTLKRIELGAVNGATAYQIVPLVEGVEYLRLEYGTDTLPNVVNLDTGLTGDASVDAFTTTPADWTSVIAAKLYLLARNTEGTAGYTDTKTYTLGALGVPAFNDRFKRHVFATDIRIMNPAERREIP